MQLRTGTRFAVGVPLARRCAVAPAALIALLLASPAGAQEPGVTLDPDSPAGTEYALPLDQARVDASGVGDRRSPGIRFGAGISRGGADPARSTDPSAHRTGRSRDPEGIGTAEERVLNRGGVALAQGAEAGANLRLGAIGLGVLLLGGAFGLLLRRLRGSAA